MITESQLKQVMPYLSATKLALYLPHLNQALQRFGVDTMLRTAAFIAQLAHESGEFRFMEEIWGPTAAQRRYEPPSALAGRLGNTETGDGRRFKGRGPIQITGRFNYRKYGDLLGVDLVAQPELAAQPEVAFSTAGLYWKTNGLNELADREDFVRITRRINGGTNGLADRQKYYERAKQVLAEGFVAAPVTRGVPGVDRRMPWPAQPLMRGYEAIVETEAEEIAMLEVAGAPKTAETVRSRRPAAMQAGAKKAPAKKMAGKKTAAKTTPVKRSVAKKAATKTAVTKKAAAKKDAPKKRARPRSQPVQL
jgi:predicted chitinase